MRSFVRGLAVFPVALYEESVSSRSNELRWDEPDEESVGVFNNLLLLVLSDDDLLLDLLDHGLGRNGDLVILEG
jgi:hypothetical protein